MLKQVAHPAKKDMKRMAFHTAVADPAVVLAVDDRDKVCWYDWRAVEAESTGYLIACTLRNRIRVLDGSRMFV